MKEKITIAIIILALILLSVFTYRSKQTVYNDEFAFGNSSGNLLNDGLFCEYEGHIYFSNPSDEGRLYVMTDTLTHCKKLSADTAESINAVGKYIYYSRHNNKQEQGTDNFFTISKTGIYRMDKNGKNLKTLFDSVADVVNVAGNELYFTHNSKSGFSTSKISIDKSNQQMIIDEPIFPYTIKDGILYYVGTKKDHYIRRYYLDSGASDILLEGNFAYLTYANNLLYYLDLTNNHALTCMESDGTNQKVITTVPTSTYNVTPDGSYIYYQIDNGTEDGIYRHNLQNNTVSCIKQGHFSNIHTTSNYAFFKDFEDGTWYTIEHSASGGASPFAP